MSFYTIGILIVLIVLSYLFIFFTVEFYTKYKDKIVDKVFEDKSYKIR